MKDNKVGKAKWRSDVWVSPVYLRKLCDLFIRAGVRDFKLSIKDAGSAMRLMARNGETDQLITALLMPVQGDDERLSSSRSKSRKKKPVEQPAVEVAAQTEEPEVPAPEEPIDDPAQTEEPEDPPQMDEPEDPPAEAPVVETPAPPRRKRKSAKKSAEKEA
jgi:outer membrane biosynthesis protein TonB